MRKQTKCVERGGRFGVENGSYTFAREVTRARGKCVGGCGVRMALLGFLSEFRVKKCVQDSISSEHWIIVEYK